MNILFVFLITLKNRLHNTNAEMKANPSLPSFMEVAEAFQPLLFFF